MCGRFALALTGEAVARAMDATLDERHAAALRAWLGRFNITPSQPVPVVVADGEARRVLTILTWGLVPFWSKDPSIGARLANARGESLDAKPAFREAWKRRRCLVPATAFYEWQASPSGEGPKQPFAIGPEQGEAGQAEPLALGAIWERWRGPRAGVGASAGDDEVRETFAIITVEANATMRPIHDRMPVLVPRSAWGRWLASPSPPSDLVVPAPDVGLRTWAVSRRVNNPRHDAADCLQPA